MQKNEDYLTIGSGRATWSFYIDSKITQSDDVPARTASVVERVFTALGTDIVPVRLKLGLTSIPTETPVRDAIKRPGSLADSPFIFEDRDGFTFENYAAQLADIPIEDNTVLYIGKVGSAITNSRIYLRSGMQTIGAERSPYFRFESSDAPVGPEYAPIAFSILHLGPRYGPEDGLDGDSVYKVGIGTDSDIWFDETPIAKINRARLHALLYEIDSALPVFQRSFIVDNMKGYGDADAEALFNYDGPPAKELIKEYRIDWVESELVETAAQYEENGSTVFEVTSDAESITTDELRKRIEVYVNQQQTKGNAPQADRLRIIRTDGTPLEARFSDSDIEWTDDDAEQR